MRWRWRLRWPVTLAAGLAALPYLAWATDPTGHLLPGTPGPLTPARLLADDGGIWVQRAATARELVDRGLEDFTFEELGSRVWDLFTPGGRYRAEVVLPERFHLTRVRDGRLFGNAITPDGHPVVQRLRLEGAVREPAA